MDKRYKEYIEESPLYFQFGDRDLAKQIRNLVSEGKGGGIAEDIEFGRIHPSKKLVETVGSLIEGNEEFILLDEQKVAYEKVLSLLILKLISLFFRREEFKDKGAKPAKPKKGQEDPLYDLIRNTYKTLMTRGMKGCYVYCCDEALQEYLKEWCQRKQ